MTSKRTNKFSAEVRDRAVRMVRDYERDYPSRSAAVVSIADKVGCMPQTLHEWVKKAEVDSGKRAGVPTDMAEKLKALERRTASCARPTRSCARRRLILPRRSSTARSSDHRLHRRSPAGLGVEPICKVLPIASSTYRERQAQRRDPARLSAPGPPGPRVEARDRPRVRRELRGLRRAQGLATNGSRGPCRRPLQRGAIDAGDGPAGGDSRQACAHDDQRQGRALSTGPR